MLGDDAPAPASPSSIVPTAAGQATVENLQAQLNRFAVASAGTARLFATPLDVTGTMDVATATRASQVLVFRASTLLLEGKGGGIGAELARETFDAGTFGGMAPEAWATNNLQAITAVVVGFANSRGLPPAELMLLGYPMSTVAIAAAGVGVLALVLAGMRKGRR